MVKMVIQPKMTLEDWLGQLTAFVADLAQQVQAQNKQPSA